MASPPTPTTTTTEYPNNPLSNLCSSLPAQHHTTQHHSHALTLKNSHLLSQSMSLGNNDIRHCGVCGGKYSDRPKMKVTLWQITNRR